MQTTIITPTYNNSIEELESTIKSVKSQTYIDYKYIVINDGSSNRNLLKEICDKYKCSFIDFPVNKGLSTLMNIAIKEFVDGEYYIKLDCGDIWYNKDVLYKLVNNIKDNDCIYGDFKLSTRDYWIYPDIRKYDKLDILLALNMRNGSGIIPFDHSLHKTKFTLDNKLFFKEDIKLGMDTYRFITAIMKNIKITKLNEVFVIYDKHHTNISLDIVNREKDIKKITEYCKKCIKDLTNNYL